MKENEREDWRARGKIEEERITNIFFKRGQSKTSAASMWTLTKKSGLELIVEKNIHNLGHFADLHCQYIL